MPSTELLSPFQKKILKAFTAIEETQAFQLAGGTALSVFYLAHRQSEDFDLFTGEERLISIVARKLKAQLESIGVNVQEIRNFSSFWEAIVSQGEETFKIQLAYDSPFMLQPPLEKENLRVQSFEDIAAGKLLALFGRAEERDFIDLYCIIKEGSLSLDQIVELAKRKDPGLDEYYLAIAFEQSEKLPDDSVKLKLNLLTPVDPKEVKRFFAAEAVRLLEKNRI